VGKKTPADEKLVVASGSIKKSLHLSSQKNISQIIKNCVYSSSAQVVLGQFNRKSWEGNLKTNLITILACLACFFLSCIATNKFSLSLSRSSESEGISFSVEGTVDVESIITRSDIITFGIITRSDITNPVSIPISDSIDDVISDSIGEQVNGEKRSTKRESLSYFAANPGEFVVQVVASDCNPSDSSCDHFQGITDEDGYFSIDVTGASEGNILTFTLWLLTVPETSALKGQVSEDDIVPVLLATVMFVGGPTSLTVVDEYSGEIFDIGTITLLEDGSTAETTASFDDPTSDDSIAIASVADGANDFDDWLMFNIHCETDARIDDPNGFGYSVSFNDTECVEYDESGSPFGSGIRYAAFDGYDAIQFEPNDAFGAADWTSGTIMTWVRVDQAPPESYPITGLGNVDSTVAFWLSLVQSESGGIVTRFDMPSVEFENEYTTTAVGTQFMLETWTHIAVSWNREETPSIKMYTNGVQDLNLDCTNCGAGGISAAFASGISIGNALTEDGTDFDGYLDDVRMYNAALSPDDIYDFE
jgi:hypothetical protein